MSILDDIKLQFRTGDITTKLIFWNIGVFLLSIIFFYSFRIGVFIYPEWLSLSSDPYIMMTRPWTLLTYSFLHAGFFHLLFNMMVLNFAGRMFLTFFTQKQMLGLYLLSAIFAGIMFVVGYIILGMTSSIVGASGAIMAILIATASYAPNMNMRLLLIGNVKLWHFAAVIILLDLLYILAENTGGHIAHLAGAFFGYIYIWQLRRGNDIGSWISNLLESIQGIFTRKKKAPLKTVHKNHTTRPTASSASRIVTKDKTQQQIDEILDKISRSGYDSLTKEEKEFLFRAGKQ
ncbi:MAG TPA: rhomboid family intramembrane serine protease [Flavobacterium sp.]|jgi:membrane associated rhomboid family serine protease